MDKSDGFFFISVFKIPSDIVGKNLILAGMIVFICKFEKRSLA